MSTNPNQPPKQPPNAAEEEKNNQPIQGQHGYSPNANYDRKSRHMPKIKMNINTVPVNVIHDPLVNKETVSVIQPNVTYNSLGYFSLRSNSLNDAIRIIMPVLRSYRSPQAITSTIWTDNMTDIVTNFIHSAVSMQILNTIKSIDVSKYEAVKHNMHLFQDINVPPIINDIVQLFGDVIVQKEQRFEMTGSLFQAFSIGQTGLFNQVNPLMVNAVAQLKRQIKNVDQKAEDLLTYNDQTFFYPGDAVFLNNNAAINAIPQEIRVNLEIRHGQDLNAIKLQALGLDINHNVTVQAYNMVQFNNVSSYMTLKNLFGFLKTEPLHFTNSGKGCQLVNKNEQQLTSHFSLQAADYAAALAFDLNQKTIIYPLYQERFSSSANDIQEQILAQARIYS